MGAQQCSAENPDPRSLSFKLGNETIRVVTLHKEEILESSKVLDAILYVTSMRQSADLLYLAAPRLLATTLDNQIFKTHGLGLILFDDRKIEETIEGRITPALEPKPINTAAVPDQNLLSEFTILKSMYAQMEKTIEDMREEMKAMNHSARTTEPQPPIRPESIELPRPPTAYTIAPHPAQGPLPSFFNNNPWLDVLSRRGRAEEVTPLAG